MHVYNLVYLLPLQLPQLQLRNSEINGWMMGQVSLGLQSAVCSLRAVVFSPRFGFRPGSVLAFVSLSVTQSFSQSNARRSRRARNSNCLRSILRPPLLQSSVSCLLFCRPSFHFSSPVSCFCALLLMLVELGGHSKLQLFYTISKTSKSIVALGDLDLCGCFRCSPFFPFFWLFQIAKKENKGKPEEQRSL